MCTRHARPLHPRVAHKLKPDVCYVIHTHAKEESRVRAKQCARALLTSARTSAALHCTVSLRACAHLLFFQHSWFPMLITGQLCAQCIACFVSVRRWCWAVGGGGWSSATTASENTQFCSTRLFTFFCVSHLLEMFRFRETRDDEIINRSAFS